MVDNNNKAKLAKFEAQRTADRNAANEALVQEQTPAQREAETKKQAEVNRQKAKTEQEQQAKNLGVPPNTVQPDGTRYVLREDFTGKDDERVVAQGDYERQQKDKKTF